MGVESTLHVGIKPSYQHRSRRSEHQLIAPEAWGCGLAWFRGRCLALKGTGITVTYIVHPRNKFVPLVHPYPASRRRLDRAGSPPRLAWIRTRPRACPSSPSSRPRGMCPVLASYNRSLAFCSLACSCGSGASLIRLWHCAQRPTTTTTHQSPPPHTHTTRTPRQHVGAAFTPFVRVFS